MKERDDTYLEHLNELRKRFIRILIVFAVIFVGAFAFVPVIFDFIQAAIPSSSRRS